MCIRDRISSTFKGKWISSAFHETGMENRAGWKVLYQTSRYDVSGFYSRRGVSDERYDPYRCCTYRSVSYTHLVSCPNWMSQWGSKNLGDRGYNFIEILRYYYGNDMYVNEADEIAGIPASWPRDCLLYTSRCV